MKRKLIFLLPLIALLFALKPQKAQAATQFVMFQVPVKITNFQNNMNGVTLWCEILALSNSSLGGSSKPLAVQTGNLDTVVSVQVGIVANTANNPATGWRCLLTTYSNPNLHTGGMPIPPAAFAQKLAEVSGRF